MGRAFHLRCHLHSAALVYGLYRESLTRTSHFHILRLFHLLTPGDLLYLRVVVLDADSRHQLRLVDGARNVCIIALWVQ